MGVGFTVMVKETGAPGQPFAVGVTVMVAITAVVPPFVAVNEAMLPLPLAASPMDGVSLIQLYVAPLTEPINSMAAVDSVLQTI